MDNENFFDPPSASPNLPEDDPLRQWAMDIQRDPELHKLMATDPQAAAKRMADMGIPPPPGNLSAYTDGQDASNSVPPIAPYRSARSGPGTYGGAEPAPPPIVNQNADGSIRGNVSDNDPGSSPYAPHNLIRAGAGKVKDFFTPSPGYSGGGIGSDSARAPSQGVVTDPAKSRDVTYNAGSYLDPPILEPEPNPSAGQPLVPKERPVGTDISSRNKTADGLDSFSKSLQGVRPVPPAPPNFVGTPSAPSHPAINAPNLQALMALVGQPGPSPLGLTLGRLLATGKA